MQQGYLPFPNLYTPRLHLRSLSLEDEASLFAMRTDARINTYLDRPTARNQQEVRVFIKHILSGLKRKKWLYWALTEVPSTSLIGTICLWNFSKALRQAELGYELMPDFQKKGFMTEAVEAVLQYGFEQLELDSVQAVTHAQNQSSLALLERFRFEFKGFVTNEQGQQDAPYVVYELNHP